MRDLWDWTVRAYANEGVQAACLNLQDSADQDIPLLLWAAWCARTGRPLDSETLDAAVDLTRAWREQAIAPLRAVRRKLTTRHTDLDDAARETVRTQVKGTSPSNTSHCPEKLASVQASQRPFTRIELMASLRPRRDRFGISPRKVSEPPV